MKRAEKVLKQVLNELPSYELVIGALLKPMEIEKLKEICILIITIYL